MTGKTNFTPEQIEQFKSNPFTHKVTEHRLLFTVEFKEFLYSKILEGKLTNPQIFEEAGYDPKMLGKSRMDAIRMSVLKEAVSPEGFRKPRGLSWQEEEKKKVEDTERAKNAEHKLQYLEKRVAHLEAQIEFLKKTARIRQQYRKPEEK